MRSAIMFGIISVISLHTYFIFLHNPLQPRQPKHFGQTEEPKAFERLEVVRIFVVACQAAELLERVLLHNEGDVANGNAGNEVDSKPALEVVAGQQWFW